MWIEVIYWIGVLSCIWCVYDLFTVKRRMETVRKLALSAVLLIFSWVGMAAYLLFIRNRLK